MPKICILEYFQAYFELPFWQQLLLLGYHIVATLKIRYPKTKIDYHINTIEQITANQHSVAFELFPLVLHCIFKRQLAKNAGNRFFQNLSKAIILRNLLDKIEILTQLTHF